MTTPSRTRVIAVLIAWPLCVFYPHGEGPNQSVASAISVQQTTDAVQRQLSLVEGQVHRGPFAPDWDSLEAYRVPDWYRDAKFGIFIHWGVFSVPAFEDEWYPRNMYQAGSAVFKHHVDTYGPQSRFGVQGLYSHVPRGAFRS